MAIPILSLNLAPRPSLWRQNHQLLGWVALGLGLSVLLGMLGLTWKSYHQANRAGRDAVSLTEEARRAAQRELQIQGSLQAMDAAKEQSRWKVAERILLERALPWSRLTAELEQCMVPDMRLKAVQRTRSSGQQVVMKLKGEARTRQAEAAFIESLQGAPVFTQVVLEREIERPGGGWEFEMSLPTAPVPPPFNVKIIKPGPSKAAPVEVRPGAKPALPAAPPVHRPPTMAPPPPQAAPRLTPPSPESLEERATPGKLRAPDRPGGSRRRPRGAGTSEEGRDSQ